jgi:hypothetical protein
MMDKVVAIIDLIDQLWLINHSIGQSRGRRACI